MEAMTYDPITDDPVVEDAQYPPTATSVKFDSGGSNVYGQFYIAAGEGPHPTVIFLHGFPGHEKNFDIAQTLRRAGYNVFIFHYRGAWGSKGDFSFANVLEDVPAALEHITSTDFRHDNRVHKQETYLIGHSMGGWAALLNVAHNIEVAGVATISAFNFGEIGHEISEDPEGIETVVEILEEWGLGPLAGAFPRDLVEELVEFCDPWDFAHQAADMKGQKLLLIAANQDKVGPPEVHHEPLIAALKEVDHKSFRELRIDADHTFSANRIELAKVLLEWLKED
jgi:hypothetical protein